jgi:hypothetical protein
VINTPTGIVKADVGLGNVDNTSDASKPVSTATQTALNLKEDVANKSAATTLGTSDLLYPTQNAVKTYVDGAITTATPDATTLVKGKVQLAGDLSGTAASPSVVTVGGATAANIASATTLANAATDANTASTIVKRDVSGNFSAGMITANLTGNVTGNASTVTTNANLSGDVSSSGNVTTLATVNTTTPGTYGTGTTVPTITVNGKGLVTASSSTAIAFPVTLAGIETLTNKTLTSPVINTPTGIVKADVGLGNVDNTSDASKPVSTATQTALNFKADLASPTFTGTITIPSPFTLGSTSVTTTGTQLNYLNAITGTTGSTNSSLVFSNNPTLTTPNIGDAIGASLVLTGNVTTKHLVGVAGSPSAIFGAGANDGSTGSISGKDIGGSISFTSGGAQVGNDIIATITFNTPYNSAPSSIVLSAGADLSGQDLNKVYVSNITTSSFQIKSTSNPITTGSHKFYFMVVE